MLYQHTFSITSLYPHSTGQCGEWLLGDLATGSLGLSALPEPAPASHIVPLEQKWPVGTRQEMGKWEVVGLHAFTPGPPGPAKNALFSSQCRQVTLGPAGAKEQVLNC